jgi:hypothetical protein
MYKVKLNGTEIEEPQKIAELILEKSRSDWSGGFIVGSFGYIQDTNGIQFLDPISQDIILNEIAKNKIFGVVEVEIFYCENLLFKGKIDNSSLNIVECCFIECGITNDTLGDVLNSKRNIKYALNPTRKIKIPKKDYSSGGLYSIGERTRFKTSASGVHLNLGVPLKSDGVVNGMQNSTIGDGTFYIAPQDGFVNISGIIEWSENSSKDYDLIIIVKDSSDSIISTTIIQSYIHTGTLINRQCVINRKINVLSGYKISMWLHDSTINTAFEFDFLAQTFLQITDGLSTSDIPNSSDCYGLTTYEAFGQILTKINPTLKLKSNFFQKGFGKNDFITNGNNIRGISDTINISLEWLLTQFKQLYDLQADLSGNDFIVEKVVENSNNCEYLDSEITNYREFVNVDLLYSSIKVGYQNWQSESKLKGAEYNSIREYESQLAFGSRPLDLTNEFITAGYIIEEVRRLQYDSAKKTEENKFDEEIFLIALDDSMTEPEKVMNYNPIANLILSGGVYNLKYTPANILEYNSRKLKHLGQIDFVSGQGNSSLIIKGRSENQSMDFGSEIPYICTFDANMDFEDFKRMTDVCFDVCGETKNVMVSKFELKPQQNGKGFVNIQGVVI